MEILDDMMATSQVLLNTINSIGINKVLGDKLGFVNMNEQFFEEGIHESLDKQRFVLEILEHTNMNADLVKKLEAISKEGYVLALDDFVFEDGMIEMFRPVFPYIKYLKVDLMENDMDTLAEKIKMFADLGVELLAEKVESQEDFERCKEMGFSYFQGFFFAKPEIMDGKRIDPSVKAIMELVDLARNPNAMGELEAAFKKFPDMTVNFLRFVNSVDMAFRSSITSLRHGLNLIGQQKLVRWLMLMLYAKPGMNSKSSPLMATASMRANMMESLLLALGRNEEEELNQAFLTGVLSLMDAVFQVKMDQLLVELALDGDISAAILEKKGLKGQLLDLVVAFENQEFSRIASILESVGLTYDSLGKAMAQSYAKAEEGF
jgi:EAL and modified HD-GYP domain-containing signal transduction protein